MELSNPLSHHRDDLVQHDMITSGKEGRGVFYTKWVKLAHLRTFVDGVRKEISESFVGLAELCGIVRG